MENQRQGNLPQLVQDFYAKTEIACEPTQTQLDKYEVLRVGSQSYDEDKKPGTGYNFEGTYLVVHKCLSGSTYAGAYSEVKSAALIDASFHSFYTKARGPKAMENLKIQLLKPVDFQLPPQ